jgi:hypothetical protein
MSGGLLAFGFLSDLPPGSIKDKLQVCNRALDGGQLVNHGNPITDGALGIFDKLVFKF